MNTIKYIKFNEINPDDFIPLLNSQKLRAHLIEHELFYTDSVSAWIKEKIKIDCTNGCKVRAIILNDQLAGWCAIQAESGKHEIAIVIDDKFWGIGKNVFYEIMNWAKVLGHNEVIIHFLHTRPQYNFFEKHLKKCSKVNFSEVNLQLIY